MIDIQRLKADFDTVSSAQRYSVLGEEQWALLLEGESRVGVDGLARMVRSALAGDEAATDTLKAWHRAVRVAAQLRAHGFEGVTKRQARKLMELHDTDRVVGAIQAMGDGSESQRQQVDAWLAEARAALGEAGRTAGAQPARFRAVPPPPGVRTGQVRSMQPTAPRAVDPSPPVSPANAPGSGAPPAATRSPDAAMGTGTREFDQHVCYGRDTAVAFDRMPNVERTADTVLLKVAKAKGPTCKAGLHWNDAIRISLAPHEVLTVAGVLLGMQDRVRHAGHGGSHEKWFEVEESRGDWAGSVRLTAGEGDARLTVSIGPADVGAVIALFYRVLASQLKVDPALFPSIIERACRMHGQVQERHDARRGGPPAAARQSARAPRG